MSNEFNNVKTKFHIIVEAAGSGAPELLAGSSGLSRQQVKSAMTKGAVWLTRGSNTQRLRRAKRKLCPGDEIHFYYDTEVLAEEPVEPALVADVGGYSVWNKPYGLRSQGSKWGDHCTVTRWAERHLRPERPAFTVHRLDRAANGLILVAHSKGMAAALSKVFRSRKIEKRYRALVKGRFASEAEPLRIDQPIDGKQAVSEVTKLRTSADGAQSLLEVRIETGRKHQIRRHLADLGHPVVGDRLYGTGEDDGVDLQLQAFLLAFRCPVSNTKVEYRLP